MATRYLALLRGANVGGKNKVPMAALTQVLAAAGCQTPRTYIQSGNVVFDAPAQDEAALAQTLAERLGAHFGFAIPVLVLSREVLERMVRDTPFVEAAADSLHYLFLAAAPSPQRLQTLDPARSPPDRYVVGEGVIYLHLPQGMARTKLTNAYFDARLGVVTTARNRRTVMCLLEMMRAA